MPNRSVKVLKDRCFPRFDLAIDFYVSQIIVSFETHLFQDEWKIANVIPLRKVGGGGGKKM